MFRLSLFPALSLRRSTKAGNGKNPLVTNLPDAPFPDARAIEDDDIMRRVSQRASENKTVTLATNYYRRKTSPNN